MTPDIRWLAFESKSYSSIFAIVWLTIYYGKTNTCNWIIGGIFMSLFLGDFAFLFHSWWHFGHHFTHPFGIDSECNEPGAILSPINLTSNVCHETSAKANISGNSDRCMTPHYYSGSGLILGGLLDMSNKALAHVAYISLVRCEIRSITIVTYTENTIINSTGMSNITQHNYEISRAETYGDEYEINFCY